MNTNKDKKYDDTRTDDTDDDLEKIMDSTEMDKVEIVDEKCSNQESETSKDEQVNPFRPRASLRRSPIRQGHEGEEIQTVTEDEVFVGEKQVLREEVATDTGEWFTLKLGDNLVVPRELIAKMAKQVDDAKTAISAIHEYAVVTKNVKGLLKEKSRVAIKYLDKLKEDMAQIGKCKETEKAGPGKGRQIGPNMCGKNDRAEAVTQTAVFAPKKGGQNTITESLQIRSVSGHSKRKDRTPPLRESGKKPRRVDETERAGRGGAFPGKKNHNEEGTQKISLGEGGNLREGLATPTSLEKGRITVYSESAIEGEDEQSEEEEGIAPTMIGAEQDKTVITLMQMEDGEWRTVQSRTKLRSKPKDLRKMDNGKDHEQKKSYSELTKEGKTPRLEKEKKLPKTRGEAVTVRVAGKMTWAEVLSKVKDKIGPDAEGISMVRRTIAGNLLVEFKKGINAADFYNKLRGSQEEGMEVRRLQQAVTLEIRDLEPWAQATEVVEAVANEGRTNIPIRDVRCRVLREGARGTKLAIVEVPAARATEIMTVQRGKVKVGWVSCRVRVIPNVTRCFRCHAIGHVARSCPVELEEGGYICRKCGGKGHKMAECVHEPRCWLCEERGLEGDKCAHIASSNRCPLYREMVSKASDRAQYTYGRPGRP